MTEGKAKILVSREDICNHFGIGKKVFYDLIEMGAPIRKIGRSWMGHVDRIEGFIEKVISNKNNKFSIKNK